MATQDQEDREVAGEANMAKLEFASQSESPAKTEATKAAVDLGTDKKFFKIGEVAEILGVAPHVLRYWESEFKDLRPQKSRSQQRVYRRADVEVLLRIKHLLYERKFTIAGAKQELASGAGKASASDDATTRSAPNPAYRLKKSFDRVQSALNALAAVVHEAPRSPELAADPSVFMRERGYLDKQEQAGDASTVSSGAAQADKEEAAKPMSSGSLGQRLLDRPGRSVRPR